MVLIHPTGLLKNIDGILKANPSITTSRRKPFGDMEIVSFSIYPYDKKFLQGDSIEIFVAPVDGLYDVESLNRLMESLKLPNFERSSTPYKDMQAIDGLQIGRIDYLERIGIRRFTTEDRIQDPD
jgi:hypothetical protein